MYFESTCPNRGQAVYSAESVRDTANIASPWWSLRETGVHRVSFQ